MGSAVEELSGETSDAGPRRAVRTRRISGIDVGGTFTDIVLLAEDGAVHTKKILSTPDDYSRAIEDGIRQLLAETGIDAGEISEVAHGTTVATNAIIERKGVRVALVTTMGFRDVLEIARYRAPQLYDVYFRKPEPPDQRLRLAPVDVIALRRPLARDLLPLPPAHAPAQPHAHAPAPADCLGDNPRSVIALAYLARPHAAVAQTVAVASP